MKFTNARRLASPSRRALLASAISMISAFPAVGAAQAQQAPKAETAADENSDEIIVTARRREENVQDVPIAITVLSQQALQDNNVASVTDLRHLVPSLSGTTGLTRDAFNVQIRGQKDSNGRPGVFMYLNEVPVPNDVDSGAGLAGGPGLLFDLENVQVLKGPQGTLFGRNSVGGAVLLQSARPRNEFGGRIQIGYGNYNNREIDAAINLPIVEDKLLTRFAFNAAKRDGFTWLQADGTHPNGIDADNRDYWSVRGSVTMRPSDRFQVDVIATYQHYDSHGSPPFLVAVNPNSPGATLFPLLPTYLAQQQALGIRTHIPVDNTFVSSGNLFAISATTSVELSDNLKLRTILGYNRALSRRAFGDATPAPISAQPRTPRISPLRQYTAEVQLLGESFGGRLDWIIGGFYLKNPFEDFVIQTGTILGNANDSRTRSTTTSKALFGQGSYDLSGLVAGLKVTAGLRYTWDYNTTISLGGFGTNCTSVPTVRCSDADLRRFDYTSNALTWTLGLDYQAAPDTLLYVASRRGYRTGGVNGTPVGGVLPTYDPEYVTDYEFGVKSDWSIAGRPIRTNVAIYYQDYTDIQVARTTASLTGGFVTFTDNAAGARLWGAELETLLQLTDRLQLGAHASYLNIKYTKFGPDVSAATIADVKSRERLSPDWQYGLSARYNLPLGPQLGDLSVQAHWYWQAAFENSLNVNLGFIKIPAYGLLNLSANWDNVGGRPIDASFFMSNALDRDYLAGGSAVFSFTGYKNATYGEPRMYGVRLRYRFGGEEHR